MICALESQSEIVPVQTADVLKHLGHSLNTQWRRYRKRLKHCRERFSEAAVHDVRVEARRLLSTIELLGAFIPERDIKKVRRALKRHLDTFDRLRDTQVQLGYVGEWRALFRMRTRFTTGCRTARPVSPEQRAKPSNISRRSGWARVWWPLKRISGSSENGFPANGLL